MCRGHATARGRPGRLLPRSRARAALHDPSSRKTGCPALGGSRLHSWGGEQPTFRGAFPGQ
jgi:hypothetical protein